MTVAIVLAIVTAFPILPNPNLTPGDILTTDTTKICTPGYTQTVRNVSSAEKLAVFKRYGIPHQPGFEIDHLISLELGGSNDTKNLWPEFYDMPNGAHVKDAFENWLHRQVCSGKMKITDAQEAIRENWLDAKQTLMDAKPCARCSV